MHMVRYGGVDVFSAWLIHLHMHGYWIQKQARKQCTIVTEIWHHTCVHCLMFDNSLVKTKDCVCRRTGNVLNDLPCNPNYRISLVSHFLPFDSDDMVRWLRALTQEERETDEKHIMHTPLLSHFSIFVIILAHKKELLVSVRWANDVNDNGQFFAGSCCCAKTLKKSSHIVWSWWCLPRMCVAVTHIGS